MDDKDRQIVRILQTEGRITNLELADRVALSPSPCLRRVRALEETGVIRGYGARVDAKAFGLGLTAFVHIRLDRHNRAVVDGFERRIGVIDEVVECHLVTDKSDYLLRVMVADLAAYEDFVRNRLHDIEGITSIESIFVYSSVKDAGAWPDPGS